MAMAAASRVDPRQALSDGAVEARHLVLRREQHHAEEQRQRGRVDLGFCLLERDAAGRQIRQSAEHREAGPVERQARNAADGQQQVGGSEEGQGESRWSRRKMLILRPLMSAVQHRIGAL